MSIFLAPEIKSYRQNFHFFHGKLDVFPFFFYKVVELLRNIEAEVHSIIGEILNSEDVELPPSSNYSNRIIGASRFDIFHLYRKVSPFLMGAWGVCFLNPLGITWANYKRLKVRWARWSPEVPDITNSDVSEFQSSETGPRSKQSELSEENDSIKQK